MLASEGWSWRFTIECKSYKTVDNLQQLLENSKILAWFDQATDDAAKLNKEPMLIFKFNHTDIFVALDSKTNIPIDNFENIITITTKTKPRSFRIVKLNDLLKDIDWWKKFEAVK